MYNPEIQKNTFKDPLDPAKPTLILPKIQGVYFVKNPETQNSSVSSTF